MSRKKSDTDVQNWEEELRLANNAALEQDRQRRENPLERIADALEHIAETLGYSGGAEQATVAQMLDCRDSRRV